MSDMEGRAVPALAKGQKAGMNLQLYGGRIMPQTFGQVVEFAQMMCEGGVAIPKHLRENPGTCLRVIQQSIAWEMDPWAVASKTYSVNDQLAYEAQMIAAVIKKWAPVKERVIPYVYSGEGPAMQCSITLHHAETGEVVFYQSPKIRDITPQNSPLWNTDPQQQLGYYSIRALARRHFPEILLGVYDRDEVMAMKDITPESPVENFLNDEPLKPRETEEPNIETVIIANDGGNTIADYNRETGEISNERPRTAPPTEPEPVPSEPEDVVLLRAIDGHTDAVVLQQWQHDNHARINSLPPDQLKEVRRALADKLFDLEAL